MNIFKRAKVIYILHRHAIHHDLWTAVYHKLSCLQSMSSVEKAHLRELSTLFLYQKNIFGTQGFYVSDEVKVMIAAQACLPVLGLGIELLNGWSDVIVYPDAFQISRDERDEFGVVHHQEHLLSGESWLRGPLILSWRDIKLDMGRWHEGHNVIVHEVSHKLDMLNGKANGMPPLHLGMQSSQWALAFNAAYQSLNKRIEHHHRVCINPYAATNPAEFFAVFSEYFFCAPEILKINFEDVYMLLLAYYRQDPLQRLMVVKHEMCED